MPKKQKPKKTLQPLFHAASSCGRFVLNALPFGIAGIVVTALVVAFHSVIDSDNAADHANALRAEDANGAEYILSDAHQITTSDGYVDYDVNFRSQIVTVDGDDDADAVIQFSDYKNTAFIEACREAGIIISNKILDLDKENHEYADSKHTKDLFNDASVFQANYAEPIYEIALGSDMSADSEMDAPLSPAGQDPAP